MRKNITWSIFSILLILMLIAIPCYSKIKNYFATEGLVDEIPSIMDINAATDVVQTYYNLDPSFFAIDYATNSNDGFVKSAIVYGQDGNIDEANLLVTTSLGTGALNFSGNMFIFEYSKIDGIEFVESDSICLSFIDQSNHDIYDFQIDCSNIKDQHINFKVSSKIRE